MDHIVNLMDTSRPYEAGISCAMMGGGTRPTIISLLWFGDVEEGRQYFQQQYPKIGTCIADTINTYRYAIYDIIKD
jgi:hypothetical protein